jgi:hypothetical protein
MNMEIQYYNKIRWGLAPLAPNDAPPLLERMYSINVVQKYFTVQKLLNVSHTVFQQILGKT